MMRQTRISTLSSTIVLVAVAALIGCGEDSSGSGTASAAGDGTSNSNGVILGPSNGSSGTSNGTSANADVGVGGDTGDEGDTGVEPDMGGGGEEQIAAEIILDAAPVTLSNGFSGLVTFDVPENTVSVTITIEGADRTFYSLASWEDGAGENLVRAGWLNGGDPGAPQICTTCINRISAAAGVMATIAPNNQDSFINPGTHTISVFGFVQSGFQGQPANGDAAVTVLAKVLPEEPAEGVIDFNMHFTGAGGWSAATAENDPIFQRTMEDVATIYAAVGIRIGNVTYQDIDTNYRVIENILQDDSELQELFTQSEGTEQNAVNLFFVSELAALQSGGGFGLILGVAGGIPGPPLVQGTTRSGVAIAVESHDDPQVPANLANTVAHEVGHFLGLFHTSEQSLFPGQDQIHDPLDDTPENDNSYLMHNTGAGGTLSPWQGKVMRLNPWVRHAEQGE